MTRNNIIDSKVRQRAKTITYNISEFNKMSYQVTLTQIHKYTIRKWKKTVQNEKNPLRHIAKHNKNFTNKIHKMIHQGKFDTSKTWLIIRLFTEHIELYCIPIWEKIKMPKKQKKYKTQTNANIAIDLKQ